MNRHPHNGPDAAFITMLVIAVGFHALLILNIDFQLPKNLPRPPEQSLDVVLLTPAKKPPEAEPEQVDFLANASQRGGSSQEGQQRPAAAAQARPAAGVQAEPAAEKNLPQEREIRQQLARQRPRAPKPRPRNETRKAPTAPTKPDIAHLLASTREEISRLTAELDRNARYASERPRRKTLNAATKEYKYASYLEAWRKKVERVGNLNYPDEARRMRLRGDLLLHVALRPDGSVLKVRVVRSSGHKILDDAAIRIVKLAAPFAPFPEDIRKEVDILDITRTWQFHSGEALFSSQ